MSVINEQLFRERLETLKCEEIKTKQKRKHQLIKQVQLNQESVGVNFVVFNLLRGEEAAQEGKEGNEKVRQRRERSSYTH